MIPMGWGRGLVNPLCHHSIGTRETTMKMKMTKRGRRRKKRGWKRGWRKMKMANLTVPWMVH